MIFSFDTRINTLDLLLFVLFFILFQISKPLFTPEIVRAAGAWVCYTATVRATVRIAPTIREQTERGGACVCGRSKGANLADALTRTTCHTVTRTRITYNR